MAERQFSPDDPMELVGTRVEYPPGTDVDALIGRSLVEEYALIGTSPESIWRLFADPTYEGTHDILRRRGSAFCLTLIEDVFGSESVTGIDVEPRRRLAVRAAHRGDCRNG